MLRSLFTAVLIAFAVFAADVVFRTSVLARLRPLILTPAPNAVVDAAPELRWDGPQPMQVEVGRVGEELQKLGPQQSPYALPPAILVREGGYRVVLTDPTFGSWVSAIRSFQYHPHETPPEPKDTAATPEQDSQYLMLAFDAARQARDKARARSKDLRREMATLRSDNERLQSRIQELYDVQDVDSSHSSDLENKLLDLAAELRNRNAENAMLRSRLDSVIACTAWGYYSYPRPQTIPVTRRIVMVSNTRGEIFRDQVACETYRRDDASAASACFCVGNTWGD